MGQSGEWRQDAELSASVEMTIVGAPVRITMQETEVFCGVEESSRRQNQPKRFSIHSRPAVDVSIMVATARKP